MKLDDEAIDYLEQFIPELAAIATREAYLQALMSGQSVLIAENGQLIEVSPNGNRKVIKELKPAIKIPIGTKFEIL
jgi:hypothetical protein